MSSQDQKKYLSKLDNSRVLIIGGTSGIGYCVAEACLEHNAIVAISSSNSSRVKNAVETLQASYPSAKGRVFGVKVDLSERETLEDELKNMLDECVGSMEGGKLDHVVYTAGDALSTMKLKDMVSCIIAIPTYRFPVVPDKKYKPYRVNVAKASIVLDGLYFNRGPE
jgi:NAD(P)-dependent dehydrogenase (short-subunit alcohol dehydrogenase family)